MNILSIILIVFTIGLLLLRKAVQIADAHIKSCVDCQHCEPPYATRPAFADGTTIWVPEVMSCTHDCRYEDRHLKATFNPRGCTDSTPHAELLKLSMNHPYWRKDPDGNVVDDSMSAEEIVAQVLQ